MSGNLIFYRNRDTTRSVRNFKISKLNDFHSLIVGDNPTEVLHFDMKINSHKAALSNITLFENCTKKA